MRGRRWQRVHTPAVPRTGPIRTLGSLCRRCPPFNSTDSNASAAPRSSSACRRRQHTQQATSVQSCAIAHTQIDGRPARRAEPDRPQSRPARPHSAAVQAALLCPKCAGKPGSDRSCPFLECAGLHRVTELAGQQDDVAFAVGLADLGDGDGVASPRGGVAVVEGVGKYYERSGEQRSPCNPDGRTSDDDHSGSVTAPEQRQRFPLLRYDKDRTGVVAP